MTRRVACCVTCGAGGRWPSLYREKCVLCRGMLPQVLHEEREIVVRAIRAIWEGRGVMLLPVAELGARSCPIEGTMSDPEDPDATPVLVDDPWLEPLAQWLATKPEEVSMAEAMGVIGFTAGQRHPAHALSRVSRILSSLGYATARRRRRFLAEPLYTDKVKAYVAQSPGKPVVVLDLMRDLGLQKNHREEILVGLAFTYLGWKRVRTTRDDRKVTAYQPPDLVHARDRA